MQGKLCPTKFLGSSIQTKIWLYTTLVVAVVVGVASFLTVRFVEHRLLKSVERRSIAAENSMIEALNSVMLKSNGHDVFTEVNGILKTLPHKNVAVSLADTTGRIILSTDSSKKGKAIYFPLKKNRHIQQKNRITIFTQSQKIITLRPIATKQRCRTCHTRAGKNLGFVEISVSTKHITAQITMIRNLVIVNSLAVFLIISLVLGAAFNRLISRPLRLLATSMREVEKGDLSTRMLMKRRDEIGMLSNCFNSMLARLADMLKEIELKYQKELQHADRLSTLGELAAGIAHEIRNPLAAISGAIHVQAMEMSDDDPNKSVMEEIQEEIKRLDNSLKSFLAYSRPAKPQLTQVDLHELIEKAITLCARSGQISGIKLKTEYHQEVPLLNLDPFLMQQVLVNIIINALQAMNHQGELHVKTRLVRQSGVKTVRIIIKDNGPGISPEVLSKIFKPFFSTKSQGTGLGLAIAYRIVEQHGGKIHAESKVGVGTSFVIELPLNH